MRYRTLGRSALNVSTVSLGGNRLGDPGVDPGQRPPLVERALARVRALPAAGRAEGRW